MTLREAKQAIRALIRTWDNQRVHDVFAFNGDGRMRFRDPCACIRGVAMAKVLHSKENRRSCPEVSFDDDLQVESHYLQAVSNAHNEAEAAYMLFGFTQINDWSDWGDDSLRQRRLSPILRAEIRRRERLTRQMEQAEEVVAA